MSAEATPDPRLALVTAAIHLRRHPAHPHHCRCAEFAQAALDALGERVPEDSAPIVYGWITYDDGSESPVERWVRASDGDWISLDSTRRTTGDIRVLPPEEQTP